MTTPKPIPDYLPLLTAAEREHFKNLIDACVPVHPGTSCCPEALEADVRPLQPHGLWHQVLLTGATVH